jgi:beta-glucosidase-like glycosyl hydrolase
VPALTTNDSIPVSTSYEVVSDLLQHQMGFKGLVFTDALNMNGATNRVAQPALQAFLAGADILLLPENLTRSIANLKSHYLSGSITLERLAKSVKKILAAKYQLTLEQTRKNFYEVLPFTSFDRYLKKQIAEQSLVLMHRNNTFPIAPMTPLAFVALGTQTDNAFLNALRQYATVRQFSPYTAAGIRPNETLVVGIYADTTTPWEKQFLSKDALKILAKLSKHQNVHLVVFAKPYVLRQLSGLNEYASVLLAHQQELAFANAAAQVLFAKSEALGKLPVSLEAFD